MTSKIADRIKSSTLPITSPFRILDLCSGGGCISIGLALLLSKYNIQITGIDINPRATKLAMVNQRLLSIPTTTLNFVTNDIANANLNEFDLIISNPPYINSVDYKGLDASVLDWEDKIALIDESSASGSGFYKRIIEASRGIRKSEYGLPSLVFEYGGNEEQKSVLGDLLKLNGFESEFHKDMFESERVVYGYQ
jgi:release factor glutamine methyltransferase